jgi:hypothetical protein
LLKICSENPGHKVSKNNAIPGDCVLLYVDPQVSQPPLLSMMVRAIHLEAANLTFVEQALPILRKEHNFWTTGVILSDACNCYQHSILLIFENEINKWVGDLHKQVNARLDHFEILLKVNYVSAEPHEVVIQDHQKNKHRLSRYYAQWNAPRPESCIIVSQNIHPMFFQSLRHLRSLYMEIWWYDILLRSVQLCSEEGR